VIIPTFNEGELVAEAVASVREEEPVELVVVDDGSTEPDSLAVLERLDRDGVRVLRRPNGGLPAARWTGVEGTSAPFVLPLDGDDRLEPGALGAAADLMERHPDAGFLWGDYVEFGERERHYRAPDRYLPWSTTYLGLLAPTLLFRREALVAAGGWPPMLYEDWGLQLAMMELGITGVRYPGVLYHRRLHGTARMLGQARRRHGELYAELRRRYPEAFARRREWRRIERPPVWKRLLYPVVYGSRRFVPVGLEDMVRGSALWSRVRVLRR
jgi:glycosyltransferase involved in cell wall biosynthesis